MQGDHVWNEIEKENYKMESETMELNKQLEKEETAMAIPQEYAGVGGDDLDDVRVNIGWTSLIQKMSRAADSGDAEVGDFYDTATQKVLGKEINVILVKKKNDWAWFPSKEEKAQGITEARYSSNGIKWNTGEEVTREQHKKKRRVILYVVNADTPDLVPTMIVIKGFAWGAGNFITSTIKRFINVSKHKENKESIFSRSFRLSSEKTKDKDGNTHQMLIANLNEGFVSKEVQGLCYEARKIADVHTSIYDDGHSDDEAIKEELGLDVEGRIVGAPTL